MLRILLFSLLAASLWAQTPQEAARSRAKLGELEKKAKAESPYDASKIISSGQAELIGVLMDAAASEFAKAKACQRLGVVGDTQAVPALAALLPDPELSHYARTGLEPIPGPEADAAFREALGKLKGDLLIGVINSIARRKDLKALDALAKLRHSDDDEVARAAWEALGRIRSP
jgi:HEAT repeat protein